MTASTGNRSTLPVDLVNILYKAQFQTLFPLTRVCIIWGQHQRAYVSLGVQSPGLIRHHLIHEYLKQAARLFDKAPPRFHTLEYGAQILEEPQMEVPKELQEGPAGLDDTATAHAEWRQPEAEADQPEIQEGVEVSTPCGTVCCAVLCCAVPSCATLCQAVPSCAKLCQAVLCCHLLTGFSTGIVTIQ